MAELDSKLPAPNEREDAVDVAHNRRMGVRLFIVYVIFYSGFMGLSAFWPGIMGRPFLAGVNLSVVYGFSLIAAALVLALVYLVACRKSS